MSKTTARVDIYQCDKPGCPVKHYAERGGDNPDGLFGTVTLAINGWVGAALSWYACRIEHVTEAVQHVLDEAQEASDDR
jgi:hypothetical protein